MKTYIDDVNDIVFQKEYDVDLLFYLLNLYKYISVDMANGLTGSFAFSVLQASLKKYMDVLVGMEGNVQCDVSKKSMLDIDIEGVFEAEGELSARKATSELSVEETLDIGSMVATLVVPRKFYELADVTMGDLYNWTLSEFYFKEVDD